MIALDPKSAALILIDVQKAIFGLTLAPRSGADVVDFSDAPPRNADEPMRVAGGPPEGSRLSRATKSEEIVLTAVPA
jgi:hypothetical protein